MFEVMSLLTLGFGSAGQQNTTTADSMQASTCRDDRPALSGHAKYWRREHENDIQQTSNSSDCYCVSFMQLLVYFLRWHATILAQKQSAPDARGADCCIHAQCAVSLCAAGLPDVVRVQYCCGELCFTCSFSFPHSSASGALPQASGTC